MIHLYEILDPDPSSGFFDFEVPRYDLGKRNPEAAVVFGHTEECERLSALSVDSPANAWRGLPCTCPHDDLRVLAWPAPAGVGVSVLARDGILFIHDDGSAERNRHEEFGETWIDMDYRPEDAPIREAWQRYCKRIKRRARAGIQGQIANLQLEAERPRDGLYLFHENELHGVEEIGGSNPDELWELSGGLAKWATAAIQEIPCQALRFDAGGKTYWLDRALLQRAERAQPEED